MTGFVFFESQIFSITSILRSPPNLHPFILERLVRTKTFFTLLLSVAYSVRKSESLSSLEVRNYGHHRWESSIDPFKSIILFGEKLQSI